MRVVAVFLFAAVGFAQEAPPSLFQVAGLMKPYLLDAIPPVLYEHNRRPLARLTARNREDVAE